MAMNPTLSHSLEGMPKLDAHIHQVELTKKMSIDPLMKRFASREKLPAAVGILFGFWFQVDDDFPVNMAFWSLDPYQLPSGNFLDFLIWFVVGLGFLQIRSLKPKKNGCFVHGPHLVEQLLQL